MDWIDGQIGFQITLLPRNCSENKKTEILTYLAASVEICEELASDFLEDHLVLDARREEIAISVIVVVLATGLDTKQGLLFDGCGIGRH